MNSRERVTLAINHQEPDRVPIDLGCAESTGIAAMAYRPLRSLLGLPETRFHVSDVFQMLADVEPEVANLLHVDTVNVPTLNLAFGAHRGAWKPWQVFDGTPIEVPADFQLVDDGQGGFLALQEGLAVARMPRNGFYYDTIEKVEGLEPTGRGRHALGGVLPDPSKARHPILSEAALRFGEQQARSLHEDTDKALMGNLHLNIGEVGSFEDWFILLATEPTYLADYYSEQVDSIIESLKLYHQAVGNRLTTYYFGQDFGTQRGLMISPATFRQVMAPHYRRLFKWVHEHTTWKIFFHCCGSIYDIIPDLIEAGVDILNPVQTEAADMDPERLKREFGDRLCFWGAGIESQKLPSISTAEVRQQVQERIQILAPGGGFVFAATHNLQANAPAEKVLAAYETAFEVGKYPIGH